MYSHLTFRVLLGSLSKLPFSQHSTLVLYFKLELCSVPETVFIHNTQEQYISNPYMHCMKVRHILKPTSTLYIQNESDQCQAFNIPLAA